MILYALIAIPLVFIIGRLWESEPKFREEMKELWRDALVEWGLLKRQPIKDENDEEVPF
jgi:hypothetical protein